MHESDNGPFEQALKRLSGALQKKWKADEWRTLVQVYFDALKHVELPDVIETLTRLQTRDRWPKVGDVLAALPIRAALTYDHRVMRTAEADEYLRALRLHYHDDERCDCGWCAEAGVTGLPLRFVPDFTADDVEDRAYHPVLRRVVVVGHWAHGEELKRWYAAKAAFAAAVPRRFARVLDLVTREPGEDG